MDLVSATLLAVLVGAVASLVTLWVTLRYQRKRAFRAAQQRKLDSVVDELGDAIYEILACSVLALRDRDAGNRPRWADRLRHARSTLRRLRPRLRYRLWGIDDGLRTLISLPDWVEGRSACDKSELLNRATRLRESLDSAIRRAYERGRQPSFVERRRVRRAASDLRQAAQALGFARGRSAPPEPARARAVYPKRYATVVELRGEEFVAETEDGARLVAKVFGRSGKGSRSRIAIGAKVKLYRRETEDFWRYRFVGG